MPVHRIAAVLGRRSAERETSPGTQAERAASIASPTSTAGIGARAEGPIRDVRRAAPVPPVTTIYVTEAAMASPDDEDLLDGVAHLVRRLCMTSGYRLDEFPPAAAMAYAVLLYHRQLRDGGHASLARIPQRAALEFYTREGLATVGLAGHLALFERFLVGLPADVTPAGDPSDEALAALDRDFHQIDSAHPLLPTLAGWLRARPELVVVSPEALERTLAIIEALPPVLLRRRLEREAALAEAMTDAAFRLGYSLCAKAGRVFEGWVGSGAFAAAGGRAVEADFMATDAGPAAMLRPAPGTYDLHDATTGAPLATLSVMEPWASDPWLLDQAG